MKDVRLFDLPTAAARGNTVKPTNDFNEFKKEDIEQSIGQRFEQQTCLYGDKIAIKVEARHLTYDALNRRANLTAHAVMQYYDDRYRLDLNEKARYKRQIMLHRWGIDAQEKLKSTTVFVAGAGGSGSPLIMQLALTGFGTIIICDFDEVELSNLNRQVLHDESRIGMNKALSAAQTVQRINPNVKVIAYSQKITQDNIQRLTANASIIFDNVDDVEAKFILSRCAVQKSIPHIISSMIDMNAYAAIFHTPHTPCYHCLYDRDVLKQLAEMKQLVKDYQKNPNPVASPALFLSTGFAVNEAVKIVLGFAKEKPAYNKFFLFNQRGIENIVDSDGYRQLIYPFSRHFRELSRQQGFDWDKGWQGRFLEEIEVSPDPLCPECGKEKRKESEPLPVLENSGTIQPIAVYEPTPDEFKNNSNHLPTAALLFGHDMDMVIGLMGALKAGKAYVPLDPSYPGERLKYMLEDSDARFIITDNANYGLAERLKELVNRNIAIVNLNEIENGKKETAENPGVTINPKYLAYILYTSGSTGQPKGVMQNHRNVLHFARVYANALHLNSNDRLTLFSSYSFDAAKMDIYGALLNGGTLFPLDIKKEGNLSCLAQWLEAEDITVYHSIPMVYRYFADQLTGIENFKHLRLIVLGGEVVFKKDVEMYKKYFPARCLFVNGLGPTESTVTLQYFIDKNTEISKEAVPVGYPAAETEVLLLDEDDREIEGYGIGEIVYKSDYLALGYLNNREKTDEVFVKNPLTRRDRVYRSGDLGRRVGDGSIEYMGRKDFQVKVRGYRIELQEIEGKLDNMPGIKKSAVICKQDERDESYLTAYYMEVNGAEKIDETRLVSDLREMLPDYMVPGTFYRLEKFPLTATGKLDRKALAELADNQNPAIMEYVEPAEGIESTLAGIWKEILKVERAGTLDNFFVLGGNSLKAILMASRIHKAFHVVIPLVDIFKMPSIKKLADVIRKSDKASSSDLESIEKKDYYELSYNQKRLWFLNQWDPISSAFHMPGNITLNHDVGFISIKKTLQRVIERHESFRTGFTTINSEPVQFIVEEINFPFEIKDLSILVGLEKEIARRQVFLELASAPFELNRPPLFRAVLVKLDSDHYEMMYNIHHIITDGWSLDILQREFSLLYEAYRTGKSVELEPLAVQYKDYASWHNKRLQGLDAASVVGTGAVAVVKHAHLFWKKKLAHGVPVLELPADFTDNPNDKRGAVYQCILITELTEKLKKLAQQKNTSLFMVMFSLYIILVSRFSGQKNIVCSIIAASRESAALQKIIGFFVNSIIFCADVDENMPFGDHLHSIQADTLEIFQHQDYPLERVFDDLKIKYPKIPVSFNMINFDSRVTSDGPGITPFETGHIPDTQDAKFDIEVYVKEYKNSIIIDWSYRKSMFLPSTIEYIGGEYLRLVDYFTTYPDKSYKEYRDTKKKRSIKRN